VYNIDLSVLTHSNKSHDCDEDNQKYNNIYHNKIINEIEIENFDSENSDLEDNLPPCRKNNFPLDERNIVEVSSSGILPNSFYELKIKPDLLLKRGEMVVVQNEDFFEIATVLESGNIVKYRRQCLGLCNEELPKVIREMTENDWQRYRENLNDELKSRPVFREKVEKYALNMKLVDVHYQFDRKKLYFYYTSDGRVDFRELAKELAGIFKTRIELRQIGVRDEAKKIGGLGTCGREYCCVSFLNNFKRITTQLANEQNLSSNMSKLSGPCGKLKCCLSFEAEE